MRNNKIKTLMAVALVIGIAIFLHYINWLKPVEDWFRYFINPSSKAMYALSVKINGAEEKFATPEELLSAYQKLKADWLANKINEVELTTLRQDDDNLRRQLNFIKAQNYNSVGVEVIGKNIDPTESTIIVNRGAKDEIKVGNPAISDKGILIGKVARVEDKFSVIRLLDDNQSRVAATVANHDRSLGLIEGGYGISVLMNFIPQNEVVNVGDVAITSGLEEGMPRGLLIGTVEAVEKEAHQPFQTAVIKPFVSFNKITLASVLISAE
ncbi:MAG: rod shape-determining protein MreC [Candidatus Magasanikbacteria bacterium]|nr:rod shape-determining protein MreC [Candidatus Magasanikbacteria bacterium]